jgi:hypothetical protein
VKPEPFEINEMQILVDEEIKEEIAAELAMQKSQKNEKPGKTVVSEKHELVTVENGKIKKRTARDKMDLFHFCEEVGKYEKFIIHFFRFFRLLCSYFLFSIDIFTNLLRSHIYSYLYSCIYLFNYVFLHYLHIIHIFILTLFSYYL